MINKKEILKLAESFNFRVDIVEKDYVLGWLLAGISAQKNLSQNLIFKGGTCLKKCHLETHRLSEVSVLKKKCDHKKMGMPNFKSIKAHEQIGELDTEWKNMLAHQLPILPPLRIFWRELPSFFEWLNNRKDTEKSLKGISKEGELWEPDRMKNIYSTNFMVEKIKFSSLNRLCVELLYQDKRVTIEPYSFRKNKEGYILFYGCHQKTKKIDSFKVGNIQSVDITDKSFTPKYIVEIG